MGGERYGGAWILGDSDFYSLLVLMLDGCLA